MRLTPEIIAGMQQLALEQRRLLGPRSPWHVGDVAWGLRQHEGRESEWTFRLWRDGDRVVAWSWLKADRGLLEYDVHPEHTHLLDELLDLGDRLDLRKVQLFVLQAVVCEPHDVREPQPLRGAPELSPALQRWENRKK